MLWLLFIASALFWLSAGSFFLGVWREWRAPRRIERMTPEQFNEAFRQWQEMTGER